MEVKSFSETEKIETPKNELFFDFRAFADESKNGTESDANRKEALEGVFALASKIKERGGRALLVGGSVRDLYFHKEPKDYDMEVYGLESEAIEEVAREFGEDVQDFDRSISIAMAKGFDLVDKIRNLRKEKRRTEPPDRS